MVDTSNIFSIRTFFRCVPCGDRHIYFAGLDRISISLPSPLFLMIPSYTNKEHAREVGKKGFKDNMKGITGRHLKPSFFLCLHLLVLDRQEPLLASLRTAAMLWLLVLWIEITFFHLLSAFCLFKTPTESFQADAIVFWSTHTHTHTHTHSLSLSLSLCTGRKKLDRLRQCGDCKMQSSFRWPAIPQTSHICYVYKDELPFSFLATQLCYILWNLSKPYRQCCRVCCTNSLWTWTAFFFLMEGGNFLIFIVQL